MNISCEDGLIVHKDIRFKSAWLKWTKKERICSKCCAKGHFLRNCEAKEMSNGKDKSKSKDMKLNAMNIDSDSIIENGQFCSYDHDAKYLFSLC